MKLRDTKVPGFRFYEGDATTAAAEIGELLRETRAGIPEYYRSAFRVVMFIDVGSPGEGLPVVGGLTNNSQCFDVPLTKIDGCYGDFESACSRLGAISGGPLRVGIACISQQEYDNMVKFTIYTKRLFIDAAGYWLLFKNITRRAGAWSWLWRWFVRRYDDKT